MYIYIYILSKQIIVISFTSNSRINYLIGAAIFEYFPIPFLLIDMAWGASPPHSILRYSIAEHPPSYNIEARYS